MVERTDRVTERTARLRHRDGLGDACSLRSSGKGAGTDDACDRATVRKRRRVGSRGGNIMG
jgi:hypothetical protein